ncbi:MAG: hypothetical protein IPM45_01650 [Acidimicrobiales bacterium]|nr:hypothetical protein [Acidimicrobiales bacterium]
MTAIAVLDVGITFDADGTAYPTVVLDVVERPDVADLARVHAIEGIGDLSTTLEVTDVGLILTVRLTRPVRARFSIEFGLPDHLEVLEHAALTGNLLLATTTPASCDGGAPLWLAIDLDGSRLAGLLAALERPPDERLEP